jgi:tetratricopeptide (TPR) repeat protein
MRRLGTSAAFVVAAAFFAAIACAAPPEAVVNDFREGNAHYQAGDFAAAADAYADALKHGYDAPALHYNLANAELKRGRVGRAIYEYRRTLRLDPRYEDARANLDYARSLAVDVPPPAADPWILRAFIAIENAVPVREALRVSAGAYWATCLLLALSWLVPVRRRVARIAAVVCGSVLVLALASALLGAVRDRPGDEGVVLDREVAVRTGPDETSTVLFSLHEGAEVEVQRRNDPWVEVRISDELRGWVPAESVGLL